MGSRNADPMACHLASRIAGGLAELGITVISGGALGIDTAAHQGALAAGGATLAVIGSGFDYLYPRDNEKLFEAVAKSGALMTEFPHEQPPAKWTFPKVMLGAGEYRVTFDASSLPSGVYLARLEAGPRTETRKMLLLK